MKKDKHLGLHIDRETHYKLKYVAEYEGRKISGLVMYLIHQYIREFEKREGKIEVPENALKEMEG